MEEERRRRGRKKKCLSSFLRQICNKQKNRFSFQMTRKWALFKEENEKKLAQLSCSLSLSLFLFLSCQARTRIQFSKKFLLLLPPPLLPYVRIHPPRLAPGLKNPNFLDWILVLEEKSFFSRSNARALAHITLNWAQSVTLSLSLPLFSTAWTDIRH